MTALMDTFGAWLVEELTQRNMTQSDLSRVSGLSEGTISNIISGRRGRGVDSLKALARALKLPPERIFREAGLLPRDKSADAHNKEVEQIIEEVEDMTHEEQLEILSYIRWRNNLRKK